MNILTVIGLVLACIVGVWKFVSRLKSRRRKVVKRAKEKLDEACTNDDASDFIDGFGDVNRV